MPMHQKMASAGEGVFEERPDADTLERIEVGLDDLDPQ